MVFDPLSAEFVHLRRAERVRRFLHDLWGDDLPPSSDPVSTVLVDAVAADDLFGGEDEVVVQGDGLHYAPLAELVQRSHELRLEALLGPRLLSRLAPRLRPQASWAPAAPHTDLSGGATPYGARPAGAWEFEARTRTLTWDRQAALLVGSDRGAGSAPWDELADRFLHPADRREVEDGLGATLREDHSYEVHVRHRSPGGGFDWIRVSGRRISPPGGAGFRVVGMVSG